MLIEPKLNVFWVFFGFSLNCHKSFRQQEMKWEKPEKQHSLGIQKGLLQDKRKAHILGFKKKKERKISSSQPFQLWDSACSPPSLLLDLCDKNSVFFCYQKGIKEETLYFTGDQTFNFRSLKILISHTYNLKIDLGNQRKQAIKYCNPMTG